MRTPCTLMAAIIAGAVGLAVAGCSNDDNPANPSGPTDDEVLSSIVSGDSSAFSSWLDLDAFLGEPPSPGPVPMAHPLNPQWLSPIEVTRWYRDPEPPYTRQITTTVSGDSAFVHWTTTINGTLHLYTSGAIDHPKPFSDVGTREAIFHRYPDSTAYVRGWRLEALSGVRLQSQPTSTVVIDSVELGWEGGSRTITNPLAMDTRATLLHFNATQNVLVVVHSHGPGSVAYLHTGRGTFLRRVAMAEVTKGGEVHEFSGSFVTPAAGGIFQVAIDVLRRETLYDDDATEFPYDSSIWIVAYGVEPPPGD